MNTRTTSERAVIANGLTIPILEAGEGPLAICLHGFPDHRHSWSDLLLRLADQGYHAVAPAMRGYWPDGAAPDGSYQNWATGGDALALIEALGSEHAVVIGHDWGASAAYAAACLNPARVEKLITLAVPYGPRLGAAFLADGDQQRRSWYMFFFQTPIAAMALSLNDFAFIDRLWAEWSPGYRLSDEDQRSLKSTFAQPGVVDRAIEYYRQIFPGPAWKPEWAAQASKLGGPIATPTLYLHGQDDGCISADLSQGMAHLFTGGLSQVTISNAGHFLHLEQPEVVAGHIINFLKDGPSKP